MRSRPKLRRLAGLLAATLFGALLAGVLSSGAATAQEYCEYDQGAIFVEIGPPGPFVPGDTFSVAGATAIGDAVTISTDFGVGPIMATLNADGTFSEDITIPGGTSAGPYQVTVTSRQCGTEVLDIEVEVPVLAALDEPPPVQGAAGANAASVEPSRALAFTGTTARASIAVAVLLVAAGALMVLRVRRRSLA